MAILLKVTATLTVLFGICIFSVEGRFKRCYFCRSRGELGDCKDPFEYNATLVEGVKGVEAVPCPSGWCGKIVEGENTDYDTATERICVPRPPQDGEERCSDTVIDRKPVYMCFCQGDLCNASNTQHAASYLIPLLVAISLPFFSRHLL